MFKAARQTRGRRSLCNLTFTSIGDNPRKIGETSMAHVTPRMRRDQDAEAAAWFYQNSSDGFAMIRGRRILAVNPAWCAIVGYPAEEIIDQIALATLRPDDVEAFRGVQVKLEAEGEIAFDQRLRRGDDCWVWVRLAVKKAADDVVIVVMKDISAERLQSDEADTARRADKLLRSAAQVYPWSLDPETGRYLTERSVAKDGRSMRKSLSPEEMAAKFHPDDRQRVEQALEASQRLGEGQTVWYRHARPEGGWSVYRSTWRAGRRAENGLYEILGLTQDMNELAEARDAALQGEAAAKEAAEIKSRFLANMSHEIRTPLNGVLGVLHLLKGEGLSKEAMGLVDQALGCGEMLTQILNDVLDFSKIEAGKLELNPEPIDPAAAMNGVADMLRQSAEARGLYLRTSVEGEPGWMSVDPVRLRQVLFNLIGNAVKFTLRGGVEVRLAAVGAGSGQRLRVEVQDTGVGVAADAMAALFERFHQVDGSTTRRFGGTGLGLAIARSLVEQMGGEIRATSEVGRGSMFWFEIAAPAVDCSGEAGDEAAGWLEGLSVLVVEDNPTNRLIASRMLESLGARVSLACDGAEGVEAAECGGFDLIFMDIQMPVMDGVEAARRIRRLPPPGGHTPIVAMTANVMTHQISEYRAAGMDGAIAKPLNPAAILAELARLAGGDETLDAVA